MTTSSPTPAARASNCRTFSTLPQHPLLVVLSHGGAGPLLVALYTEDLPFKGVATVPWAAGFSAFGAAAVDLIQRYEKSTQIFIPFGAEEG